MKPICVKCERFMRPKKNGIYFLEGAPTQNDAKPGLLTPELWKPYKLWVGDLWHCPTCLLETIVGIGIVPISEHHQPEFQALVKAFNATLLIKDC